MDLAKKKAAAQDAYDAALAEWKAVETRDKAGWGNSESAAWEDARRKANRTRTAFRFASWALEDSLKRKGD
jgi:hypothetical protein